MSHSPLNGSRHHVSVEELLSLLSLYGLSFRDVFGVEDNPNPPNTPVTPDSQLSAPVPLHLITDDHFTEDQFEPPSEPGPEPPPEPEPEPGPEPEPEPEPEREPESKEAPDLEDSGTMSDSSSNLGFLDPSSAMDSSRKTKQKAEAVKIAKQQETAVHEKLKRNGLEIPKYEFLELIGKGAYGRVFKRYESDVSGLMS